MATVVVSDTGGLDFEEALATLRAAGHEAILLETVDPEQVLAAGVGCEALIISYLRVTPALLDGLPQLRVIATTTTGTDTIDLADTRARGIEVRPLPSPASEEVAAHALAGALSIIRELPASHQVAAAGSDDFGAIPVPPRISTLTLGVYGLGRIARNLVTYAAPLFGRIVAYDPFVGEGWPAGVDRVDRPEELFAAANVVSLHAPATAETIGLVNAGTIGRMRSGSYLVNVARGSLVVNEDLLAALGSGRLAGAFLDTTDPEPLPAEHPLCRHPRVQLSPHSAFRSSATLRAYAMLPVEAVLEVLGSSGSVLGSSGPVLGSPRAG